MLEVVEEVEVPEEGGGGTSAGSLPGRPAFPACEATAAEEEEEEEGGDKTNDDEICGRGYG